MWRVSGCGRWRGGLRCATAIRRRLSITPSRGRISATLRHCALRRDKKACPGNRTVCVCEDVWQVSERKQWFVWLEEYSERWAIVKLMVSLQRPGYHWRRWKNPIKGNSYLFNLENVQKILFIEPDKKIQKFPIYNGKLWKLSSAKDNFYEWSTYLVWKALTLSLTSKARIYSGEKTASSISGAGKTGQLHVKEWK